MAIVQLIDNIIQIKVEVIVRLRDIMMSVVREIKINCINAQHTTQTLS
jgi:hypothetical protein